MNELLQDIRSVLRQIRIGVSQLISNQVSRKGLEIRKPANEGSTRVRFGPYEADLHTHELWREGVKVKLVGQPFAILGMMLERPGELITRDELRSRLWPGDTFVGFDHGLNAAVNRLRDALCDSATSPKYIETLPRRGYRFLGKVERPTTDTDAPTFLASSKPGPRLLPKHNRENGSYRDIAQRTATSAIEMQEMNG